MKDIELMYINILAVIVVISATVGITGIFTNNDMFFYLGKIISMLCFCFVIILAKK